VTAATRVAQMVVRAAGVIQITLGLLFWTGNARGLVPLHMLIGFVLVLGLLVLAVLAARAGAPPGLVALAGVWVLVTPLLGLTQDQLLVGSAHWLVQVLHLLVGVAAIGLAEQLGRRTRLRLAHGTS
jgi:hypothetical protein